MAFDYGSIELGLRNPFKKEGAVNAIRGIIVSLLGVYLLLVAGEKVADNAVVGWIIIIFGISLLGSGIATASVGIIAMMRYFVGRSQPTSLSRNYSRSESSTSTEESSYVAYNTKQLIEMLVGRKNTTFVEPEGFLARLLHSFFPRLTYMPYPVRNMAQHLFGAWIKSFIALVTYGFVAFVSLTGFAGEIGKFMFPIYSVVLVLYLLLTWRSAGKSINRLADKKIPSMGNMVLVRTIAGAILLPVMIAFGLQFAFNWAGITLTEMNNYLAYFPEFHTMLYLITTLVAAVLVSIAVATMLYKRLSFADPKAEVSELRENWQESVHPNEIFINLDNLVMANRRYKEVPNRVYQELDPILNEQVEGKGNFFGEMIQEVQPKVTPMELGQKFEQIRLLSMISGNLLFLVASIMTLLLAYAFANAYSELHSIIPSQLGSLSSIQIESISNHAGTILHLLLSALFIRAFAQLLTNSAHLFFAEMLFESNLIYFKVEGTFTESKISTGASIHDSTRSENTLVRSSITPWVIVSRIVSSTFAASGIRNLEYPRFIMEMHKNDAELTEIRKDVINFLKDRESIAAITSDRDLHNASQIHQINQQSRAIPVESLEHSKARDDEAGGYLRQEAERQSSENNQEDSENTADDSKN